jgi:hypothetical protein
VQIYENTLIPQTRKIKKNKHSVLHIDRIKKAKQSDVPILCREVRRSKALYRN